MDSAYNPSSHIQRLSAAPRDETVLDQREITVQSYQSTVPFEAEELEAGLEGAWLSPKTRFGVFSRLPVAGRDSLTVVLGLQDALSIRTYDYDERRPLWYSWQNVIVDTVSVHYFQDEHGLLQFTATGGGRRITDDLLHEFNATHLGIPKGTVTKRHFDLAKLRSLCFNRFRKRLYMLRFADPSGDEYRSIDHALFQSRKYIDPEAERLKEIQADAEVTIESFDSDIEMKDPALASSLHVRFFLRGLSGSLRLRFPKIRFKTEPTTAEDQARAFYQLVATAVRAILDADYYTHQPRTLDELDLDLGMFPDMVDLDPFREVLATPDARQKFLLEADFGDHWPAWKPHMRAIEMLVDADGVFRHCSDIIRELAIAQPHQAMAVLDVSRVDARTERLAGLVASACWDVIQQVPASHRAGLESLIFDWSLAQPAPVWSVNTSESIVQVGPVRMALADLSLGRIAALLAKLLDALHRRLKSEQTFLGPLLSQMKWCTDTIAEFSPSHIGLPAALQLIAAGKVPSSLANAARVLPDPAISFEQLDDGLLRGFGLPAWPLLCAVRTEQGVNIANNGIGAAIGLVARPEGVLFNETESDGQDLLPSSDVQIAVPDNCSEVELRFQKFGSERSLTLQIATASQNSVPAASDTPNPVSRKRLEQQRTLREQIDPTGLVVGASSLLLAVFEEIATANELGANTPVLILGETGVGKTHIAKLIHDSGHRPDGPFVVVNAGGSGGDPNIQRGEWVGVSPGHGVTGVDPKGKEGHLTRADGGTLFIDEFAQLSSELQAVFLSVLEGQAVQTVGGESITPSVRCIFATNAVIEEEIAKGTLKHDLVHRMGLEIRIAPLRERRVDILLLLKVFVADAKLDDRCKLALLRHDWPGNIRELKKTLERAAARAKVAEATQIQLDHLGFAESITAAVTAMPDKECRRELWTTADAIARAEGYGDGAGVQRRSGEILGVQEAQASKMYKAFGLAKDATPKPLLS